MTVLTVVQFGRLA